MPGALTFNIGSGKDRARHTSAGDELVEDIIAEKSDGKMEASARNGFRKRGEGRSG
jgi:hypothetical protein